MPTNKELLEKNKTLREENKKLKEEVKNYKDTLDEHFYHYEKLQKENHENGSIIEKLDNCIANLRDENKQISLATSQVKEQKLSKELTDKITARVKEAIDKERTKSEKLTCEVARLKKELHKLKSDIKEGDLPELKDLNSRWAKKRDENGDSFRRMIKEYKEEINKLKKELYLYKDKPQLGRSYANSLRENKELQEEIEKLTCEVARLKNKI